METPRHRRHFEFQIDMIRKEQTHVIYLKSLEQNKERILKFAREKCELIYKGKHIRMTSAHSTQIL
jgi:hypothetical protein